VYVVVSTFSPYRFKDPLLSLTQRKQNLTLSKKKDAKISLTILGI
jgi:hypothetical protein